MKLFFKQCVFYIILCSVATFAQALEKKPYTEELFSKLQKQGEVVLIDVNATWCSTCAKQQNAIKAYIKSNPNKKFHVLNVDYDKDKEAVRKFRAPRQSTLLLYKGEKQFWYSVAESRPDIIAAELTKAIDFKPKS